MPSRSSTVTWGSARMCFSDARDDVRLKTVVTLHYPISNSNKAVLKTISGLLDSISWRAASPADLNAW